MNKFPKSYQRVAVSAYLGTSAIQAERDRQKKEMLADADLRVCLECRVTTHAYICPTCSEFETLATLPDAEKFFKSSGRDLWFFIL